jgi:hypothetical protein
MLKPWSISTTVRNPNRLRDFLVALQPLEGHLWNEENQERYQKLLIKNRLYGYGKQQFYNGLPKDLVDLVSNADLQLSDEIIDRIVELKNYTDFNMRGRQSLNPLTKFGFVLIDDGTVRITELGHKFILSERDPGDVLLQSFIKWQIPNPASDDYTTAGNYDLVPFVGTLGLICEVNRLEAARGNKSVGLSKREFSIFVPSLVHYSKIGEYARKIIQLRDAQKGASRQERKQIRDNYRQHFAAEFLGTNDQIKIDKFLLNIQNYGDNTIRYFRLTKFIRIRGNGFYVDLEDNRHTEIQSLLEAEFYKAKQFANKGAYLNYMADDSLPKLPWETREKLLQITESIYHELSQLRGRLGLAVAVDEDVESMSVEQIIAHISLLREERRILQQRDNHLSSQPVDAIEDYISQLENIFTAENRPLMLEYLSTMGLHSLNDAKEIKPNYPVGDDNQPTFTAPGGMADIECYYGTFSMICEVTMLNGRDQWFNEGQPVMRHLRDFESKNKNSYCMFIAPTIHTDSAETFWIANTVGYKGKKQRIAPITIKQFINLLNVLKSMRESNRNFSHDKLLGLISGIAESANEVNNSDDWVANTQDLIDTWSASLLSV